MSLDDYPHDYSSEDPYDDPSSPFFPRPRDPFDTYDDYDGRGGRGAGSLDRLTHLVLVDGRLVDTWSEPVQGTRWQSHAEQFDRALRRAEPGPPLPPPAPPYDVVLEWLGEVCGGDSAVADLGGDPLDPVVGLAVEGLTFPDRHRVEAVAELLEAVGEQCFDEETLRALRQAMLLVWAAEPDTLLRAKTAAHATGGLCWAVGRANGSFGTQGLTTQKQVQEALALPSPLSGPGAAVQRALRGFSPFEARRPPVVPDLLALGHASILVSPTRRLLVRLRDRAVAAKEAAGAT